MNRMGSAYDSALYQRLGVDPQPVVGPGQSGYFTRPTPESDPVLLHNDRIRPEVRRQILRTLYAFWLPKYQRPEDWSTVWIAGSALTHQWSAQRGNGDLDVLVGVDYPRFYAWNPEFRGLDERQLAKRFNAEFNAELLPGTAHEVFTNGGGSRTFEETFYVNPGATDIRAIHPYAAYNLSADEWTVKPVDIPLDWDPHKYFPEAWWQSINAETARAWALVRQYEGIRDMVAGLEPYTAAWVNAMTKLSTVAKQCADLFNDIHAGRHNAFSEGGNGYADYYNFRWQASKMAGTNAALKAIQQMTDRARQQANESVYGGPLLDTTQATTQAALWATGHHDDALWVSRANEPASRSGL